MHPLRCIFLSRFSPFDIGPSALVPLYLLHHQWALVGLDIAVVAVVEDIVASILGEYLAAVARSIEVVALLA